MDKICDKLADIILNDYRQSLELPGERILAERYACTRTTVRAALKRLQERNLLSPHARKRHKLNLDPENRLQESVQTSISQSAELCKKIWNVVLFVSESKMLDQNILDFIGGVVHAARLSGVNLLLREIDEAREVVPGETLNMLHQGFQADGYILSEDFPRLGIKTENELKPCIILGVMRKDGDIQRRRVVQVALPYTEKLNFIFNKLAAFGHRKVLVASASNLKFQDLYHNMQIDSVKVAVNIDSTVPMPGQGEKVAAALHDHTALLIPFGGATAVEIYRGVVNAGYEVPRRLSVSMDTGRFDYFPKIYRISNIFSSAREEGMSCIEEIVCQLKTGSLNFSERVSHYTYCDLGSIDRAMTPAELAAYEKQIKETR